MGSLIDIIGSTMIGAIVILMVLNVLDTRHKFSYKYSDDLIVQQNLTSISKNLEYDLKKMGFAVPEEEDVLLLADSLHLRYRGDVDRNWQPDTVEYYVGPVSGAASTPNPRDRFLYRKVNGNPSNGDIVGLVTEFKFEYLNQDAELVDTSIPSNISSVKMMRITLRVENPAVYSGESNPSFSEYESAFWQQTRLVSRNLRR